MAGDSNWSSVVLLMHFDGANSATTFHDSSLSNHGFLQVFGSSISTTSPLYGTGALDGNSGNGSMYTSSTSDFDFGNSPFTLEASVYPTSATSRSIVMNNNFYSGSDQYWAWNADPSTSTNNIVFWYTTDGSTQQSVTGSFSLPLNTWTQLAVDYNGTTLRLYANGAVVGTGSLAGAIFPFASTGSFATNDQHFDSNAYAGYLDEFRITKGVARYAGAYTAPTAAFPAYGTSPQPESVGTGAGTGNVTNGSLTYNLTTWEPNDILVVAVFNENHGTGNPATVSSITASGLTFAQRSIVSAVNGGGMEVWWALATTPLIALSMTIAFTGSFDDASSVAYGVAGCYNLSNPWDSNGSLPATASGFSITGVSTSQADDSLLSFVGSESGPGNPFGYTVIAGTSTFGGSLASAITTGYQNVSSTQSGLSPAAATGSFPAFIIDALTADSSSLNASPSITGVEGNSSAGNVQLQYGNTVSLGGAFALGLVEGFAEVGDPSWIVSGSWFTDTSTPTGQTRIFTTAFASTNIEATFSGNWLDITVQTSLTWGDIGIYASDDSTLLDTVTCNIDTGGQLNTTTLTGFGPGSHTIFLQKTTNDSNPIVLVSLAWQDIVANPSIPIVGVAATGLVGTALLEIDAVGAGVSATGAANTVSLEIDNDRLVVQDGVSAIGQAGIAIDIITSTLGSVSATGSIGPPLAGFRIGLLPSVSAIGLAGNTNFETNGNLFIWLGHLRAIGSAGNTGVEIDISDLSASATGSVGIAGVEIDTSSIAVSAMGAADAPLFELDSNVNLSNVSATGSAGNLSFTINGSTFIWLGDVEATGLVSDVGIEIDVSDLSVSATGSAGNTSVEIDSNSGSVSATGAVGSFVGQRSDATVPLIGVSASGLIGLAAFLGSKAVEVDVHITGASATGGIGTVTVSSFSGITAINFPAVAASGLAGTFGLSFGNSVTLIGVAATGIANPPLQGSAITGVAGAGSVIRGDRVTATDLGGANGFSVTTLLITTTATVPIGAVIVVAVSLNSPTLVVVTDGTNTYRTTSVNNGSGTVAQISWTAPLTAPLTVGSTITLTPLGLMSVAASAFYLTNVSANTQSTNGNALSIASTNPREFDVSPQFANNFVVEVLAINGPLSDIFTQDPNGWNNLPVRRGPVGPGSYTVAGGVQYWPSGILTYAPTITAEPWAIIGLGFPLTGTLVTNDQIAISGVAATGSAGHVTAMTVDSTAGIGLAGTVSVAGATTVDMIIPSVSATGMAGMDASLIDILLAGVGATGSAGVLFPHTNTRFFVVT